jgi:hypothetical protein
LHQRIEGLEVATTQLFPIYTKISRKILGATAGRRGAFGNRVVGRDQIVVEGLERFWLALRCPSHTWSWPRANHEERLEGFDAHQTCHKCTSQRMFDTREWQAGPVYRHLEQTNDAG